MTPTDRRFELHELLCEALGSRQVYFQPPETVKIKYPAIVYNRDDVESRYADCGVYLSGRIIYQITVIDKDPDSELVAKMAAFPTSRFERHFVADNLNHDVFTIFY